MLPGPGGEAADQLIRQMSFDLHLEFCSLQIRILTAVSPGRYEGQDYRNTHQHNLAQASMDVDD